MREGEAMSEPLGVTGMQAVYDGHGGVSVDNMNGDQVAYLRSGNIGIGRLFAASPDLLDALDSLWEWQRSVQELPPEELSETVRYALTKAKGGAS
jgi:hypothetical protein